MVKVIGVDPGLAESGIGIIEGRRSGIGGFSYGCIRTSRNASPPQRLERIYTKFSELLSQQHPDLMVIEDVYVLKAYPLSAIILGKVVGVFQLAAFQHGLRMLDVPVREAKQVLTGSGTASKMQLEAAVRHTLKLEQAIRPYHASDALALALIGVSRFPKG